MDPTADTPQHRDVANGVDNDYEPTESTVEIVFEGENPAAEPDGIVHDDSSTAVVDSVVAAKAAIMSAQQRLPVMDGPEVDESDDYVEFETECPPQESSPMPRYLNDIDYNDGGLNDPVVSAQPAALTTDTPEEREYYIREALKAVSRAEPMDAAANPHSNKNRTKLLVAWVIMVAVLIGTVAGVVASQSSSSSSKNADSSPSSSAGGSDSGKTAAGAFTSTQQLYDAVDAYLFELELNGTVALDSPVSLQYGYPMSTWDVSRITHFDRVFDPNRTQVLDYGRVPNAISIFDEDLSGWDVSNAVSLWGMFAGASNFTGQGLSSWNVAKVSNFSYAFAGATLFNGNVSAWDTARATTMECMFFNALAFNQDVSGFAVSNVESMLSMFENAAEFQGRGNLEQWDVSNVKTMESTFAGCSNFQGNVSSWDTSNVTDMDYMVRSAGFTKRQGHAMV
jgi:surface protein